jgi:hypothetical protein
MRTIQRLDWGEVENPPLGYLVNIAEVLEVELVDICEERWLEWMVFDETAKKPPPRGHWRSDRE